MPKSNCNNCQQPIEGSEHWLSMSVYENCDDCKRSLAKKKNRVQVLEACVIVPITIALALTPVVIILWAAIKIITA